MMELYDLLVDVAAQAAAVADAALRGLSELYAAGASNGMDPGPLAGGAAAGGAAGGAAAAGSGRSGDRGFTFPDGDGTVFDRPSTDGTVVGKAARGGRLVYDGVVRDASGNPTYYHVNTPGGASGYIPAGSTSDTRPTAPPPPRPSVVIDSGVDLARTSSAQTAGSRG